MLEHSVDVKLELSAPALEGPVDAYFFDDPMAPMGPMADYGDRLMDAMSNWILDFKRILAVLHILAVRNSTKPSDRTMGFAIRHDPGTGSSEKVWYACSDRAHVVRIVPIADLRHPVIPYIQPRPENFTDIKSAIDNGSMEVVWVHR